jgi:hypothetical protein
MSKEFATEKAAAEKAGREGGERWAKHNNIISLRGDTLETYRTKVRNKWLILEFDGEEPPPESNCHSTFVLAFNQAVGKPSDSTIRQISQFKDKDGDDG